MKEQLRAGRRVEPFALLKIGIATGRIMFTYVCVYNISV